MSLLRKRAQELAQLLDRPGGRWILRSLLPLYGRFYAEGLRRLRYEDGWIHDFGDFYLVDPKLRVRAPEQTEERNRICYGFLYEPRPGDTVVDVGAGLGWESVHFGRRVGPKGRVLAIEAHPTIFRFLQRTIELNRLDQVQCLNAALADRRHRIFIEDDVDHHLGNALVGGETGGLPVEAMPLDEICGEAGVDRIDYLKMNIEGAEGLAIAGMERTASRTAVVCVSCHDFRFAEAGNAFFRTKAAVDAFFRDHGFVVVPREHEWEWLSDQVNAYHPGRIDRSLLRNA